MKIQSKMVYFAMSFMLLDFFIWHCFPNSTDKYNLHCLGAFEMKCRNSESCTSSRVHQGALFVQTHFQVYLYSQPSTLPQGMNEFV